LLCKLFSPTEADAQNELLGQLTAVLREIRRSGLWHIDNALDAKITAGEVHNGEGGFHIHILWLYNSSISQSHRGLTDFGGICSGIPRLNTARAADT
jgi:flagellar motor component MotA